jgi:hypothetical protein
MEIYFLFQSSLWPSPHKQVKIDASRLGWCLWVEGDIYLLQRDLTSPLTMAVVTAPWLSLSIK